MAKAKLRAVHVHERLNLTYACYVLETRQRCEIEPGPSQLSLEKCPPSELLEWCRTENDRHANGRNETSIASCQLVPSRAVLGQMK